LTGRFGFAVVSTLDGRIIIFGLLSEKCNGS